MPDAISVHRLLSEDDRQLITAVTGAHMKVDTVSARSVYIGARTKMALAKTIEMLDNLFSRFVSFKSLLHTSWSLSRMDN